MHALTLLTLGLAALLTAAGAASAARPQVEDLLEAAPGLAEGALRGVAAEARDALAGASGAAGGAVQAAAEASRGAVDAAVQDANAGLERAAQDAYALVLQAYHLPDPAVGQAMRKYDDLEQAPPLLGGWAQRRIGAIPALDTPWLVGAQETYAPYVAALGAASQVRVGFAMPIGEVPVVTVETGNPQAWLPDPQRLVPDTRAYVEGNLPGTQAWADDATADTLATAGALADLLTR